MARLRHDWNSLENYYQVHYRVLKHYSWRFTSTNVKYTHRQLTDQWEQLEILSLMFKADRGQIVELKIEKDIEVDRSYQKPRAKTFAYSYQAKRVAPDNRIYFRFCSSHEDHNCFHHKHVFNINGTEQVIKIDDDKWPHVNEFFDEVATIR